MNPALKILLIDTVHPVLIEKFTEAGFECKDASSFAADKLSGMISSYEGIIIRSRIKIDKAFLDKADNLKFIGRVGAGLENIDVEYARSKGIQCFNSPEGNRDAVAEHTLGMLLCLMNNICTANEEVRNGIWQREQNRGVEISGKTIGIIGVGNMGSAFAQRLAGFNAEVLGYDKYKFNYSSAFIKESSMQELFDKADIISLHVPLTDETTYMANSDFFSSFKKNIILLNTSRGKVLKTEDLVASMKSGKVTGAALDVMEYESSSFENISSETISVPLKYLFQNKNVVFSPHIAGWTIESNFKLSAILADKILSWLKNK